MTDILNERAKKELQDTRLDLLIEGYLTLSQAYHNLANIVGKQRHWTPDWRDCDEQTCINSRKLLTELGINYWRYKI